MNKRIAYLKDWVDEVDPILVEKLSKKKYEHLIHLIRSMSPWSSLGIKHIEEFMPPSRRKPLMVAKEIISIYEEAGVEEKQWAGHWEYYRLDQTEIKKSYKQMTRPPRQDNKTYLNTSPSWGSSNKNKIRYPRKVRKTAWKRFYKLFPHLLKKEE